MSAGAPGGVHETIGRHFWLRECVGIFGGGVVVGPRQVNSGALGYHPWG